jgi:exo-beta-1,3-glucanase (GH17 family)
MSVKTHILPAVLFLLSTVSAVSLDITSLGFVLDAHNAAGACKTGDDWSTDFQAIRAMTDNSGTEPLTVRLRASRNCNSIHRVLKAAQASNIKLFIDLWVETTSGNARSQVNWEVFGLELDTLHTGLKYSNLCPFLAGVSFGGSTLHGPKGVAPSELVKLLNVVLVSASSAKHPTCSFSIGHTTTVDNWLNPAYSAVVNASSVIMLSYYPDSAPSTTTRSVAILQADLDAVAQLTDKPILVAETGWPSRTNESASIDAARNYFEALICPNKSKIVNKHQVFWDAFDEVRKFTGLADAKRMPKFALDGVCPAVDH